MGALRRAGPQGLLLALGVPCLSLFLLLPPPEAAFAANLSVRELYPGSVSDPGAEYVELQASADGQGAISGQSVIFYDADADPTRSFVIPSGVANGQSQRMVLFATKQATENLAIPAPDFDLGEEDALDPDGGAVCFAGAGLSLDDCASWGTFPITGLPGSFPDPQSAGAAEIADELALRRSILRGCASLLDGPDDSDDSDGDFEEVTPGPRNNSEAPTETPCPPDTAITTFPMNPNNATSASFTYGAFPEEGGTTFKCSLDDPMVGNFTDCTAGKGKSYPGPLSDGPHTFQVYAIGPGGSDPTPDSYTWTVDTEPPETMIDSGPPDPSSGFSAGFAFHSSELGSSFRCRLNAGPIQTCSGATTYINLPCGVHVFRVFAIDSAGNEDKTPVERRFTVDNSIEDITPPDTRVVTAPRNPSPSENASFTYTSIDSGIAPQCGFEASFQCRLDGATFTSCLAAGIGYSRLRNGIHTFAVRSTDRAGNVDGVPATFTWGVRAPLPVARIIGGPPGRTTIRKSGVRKLAITFRLTADKPGSTFRCRLDKQTFRPCSPTTRTRVGVGRHRFEAYAIDALGNEGTVTARRIFRVQRESRRRGLF